MNKLSNLTSNFTETDLYGLAYILRVPLRDPDQILRTDFDNIRDDIESQYQLLRRKEKKMINKLCSKVRDYNRKNVITFGEENPLFQEVAPIENL